MKLCIINTLQGYRAKILGASGRSCKSLQILSLLLFTLVFFSCKSNEEKLFDFIETKEYGKLRTLISESAELNINFKNEKGVTPLFYAISLNDYKSTELLIDNGANYKEIFGDTITIFGLCLLNNEESIIDLIAEQDTLINMKCYKNLLPVEYAVMAKNPELVSKLIALNANINIRDSLGNTPLFYARDVKTFELLLNKGAK
ncbi:MAG: hypothetical protein ABIJ16_10215, partial [Bacteroidota bacterium]